MILEVLHYSEILILPLGGLHVKQAMRRGNFGINSASDLGSRKTTENLDRVGRSQDLPDANWLPASSPVLNTRTLTSVPIWMSLYLKKKSLHICF
jgi:hypothetical protein